MPLEPGGHVVGGAGVQPGGIPPGDDGGALGVPVDPGGQLTGMQASPGEALASGVPHTYGDTNSSLPGVSDGGEVDGLGAGDSDEGGLVGDEGAGAGVSVCAGGAGGCSGVVEGAGDGVAGCSAGGDSDQPGCSSGYVAEDVAAPTDSSPANANAIAMPSRSNVLLAGIGLTWDLKLGPSFRSR